MFGVKKKCQKIKGILWAELCCEEEVQLKAKSRKSLDYKTDYSPKPTEFWS